jgi:hypothetical protein
MMSENTQVIRQPGDLARTNVLIAAVAFGMPQTTMQEIKEEIAVTEAYLSRLRGLDALLNGTEVLQQAVAPTTLVLPAPAVQLITPVQSTPLPTPAPAPVGKPRKIREKPERHDEDEEEGNLPRPVLPPLTDPSREEAEKKLRKKIAEYLYKCGGAGSGAIMADCSVPGRLIHQMLSHAWFVCDLNSKDRKWTITMQGKNEAIEGI